ncbi:MULTISPECIES: YtpI family protein [Bacillaceae]|uniref:YtpI family protein n=1 Tax=Metabacillus sediminis TaxID=3117746 RepID=A0ABZ2NDP8_9BACI|nr:YtpI family protein [Bacillus sp. SJS]KZZ85871.1 hypothetical protein AS29_003295 [Bacillus sp. SJS]
MPILAFLIVAAFSFYFFYKLKYYRSGKPMERGLYSGKSRMALGVFVFLFGVNQFFLYPSAVSISIGIIFIILGAGSFWAGQKMRRHYRPLADKEHQKMSI